MARRFPPSWSAVAVCRRGRKRCRFGSACGTSGCRFAPCARCIQACTLLTRSVAALHHRHRPLRSKAVPLCHIVGFVFRLFWVGRYHESGVPFFVMSGFARPVVNSVAQTKLSGGNSGLGAMGSSWGKLGVERPKIRRREPKYGADLNQPPQAAHAVARPAALLGHVPYGGHRPRDAQTAADRHAGRGVDGPSSGVPW